MPASVDRRAVEAAAHRLAGRIRPTPVIRDDETGVWLKCEQDQITGSFKLRGAFDRLLRLTEAERRSGVVAASAGNHGQGVAFAARALGIQARIVVPAAAVARKVEAMRRLGAEVILAAGGYAAAEAQGRQLAVAEGAVWVSPYNDAAVIAGQGTLGLEIETAWEPSLRAGGAQVFVPVGGGGLAAGIGAALDAWRPGLRVIGVLPEHSAYLHAFFHHGSMGDVVEQPTLADGLAGAVEDGSITLGLVKAYVDDMRLVSEDEIREALAWACRRDLVIEPSAAVALAGALRDGGDCALAVLSGGNVDPGLWESIRQHAQA
jgi:threonine dehydratase